MTDIRKLEQAIIRPTLMLDFIHMSEQGVSPRVKRARDIMIGILIALVIMQ